MILLLLVAGYLAFAPLLLGIVNCLVLARPKDCRKPLHRLSLLIPARNEAAVIATTLRAALASDHTDFEVIVLDDHSTDETAAIVESFARTDPRLRLEQAPALPPGWSGKMHACHHLGQRATGELMVFIDCDVTLQPHALSALDGFMGARPSLAYASGVPRQITPTLAEKLVVTLIDFLLLAYLPLPWMRRSRRPGLAAGCGQLVVVRRTAYMAAGGHGAIPRTLHDGLKLPRRFREMGLATDLFGVARFCQERERRNGHAEGPAAVDPGAGGGADRALCPAGLRRAGQPLSRGGIVAFAPDRHVSLPYIAARRRVASFRSRDRAGHPVDRSYQRQTQDSIALARTRVYRAMKYGLTVTCEVP
jgi:glycosyltransferase involved in cell wall biosynthesis